MPLWWPESYNIVMLVYFRELKGNMAEITTRFILYLHLRSCVQVGAEYRRWSSADGGETLAWSTAEHPDKANCENDIKLVRVRESYLGSIIRDLTLVPF